MLRQPPTPLSQVPIYDFKESRRVGYRTVEVPESRVVILEGIYALNARLRPLLDLRVSITGGVHFDLVKRVLRDINRSGQAPEEIIQQVGAAAGRAAPTACARHSRRQLEAKQWCMPAGCWPRCKPQTSVESSLRSIDPGACGLGRACVPSWPRRRLPTRALPACPQSPLLP